MIEEKNSELSRVKNKSMKSARRKRNLLFISLLVVFQFLFYFFTLLYFYIPYFEDISIAYSGLYYLPILTVIITIRIIIYINLTYILFKMWISQKEPHYSDIPFLIGLSFYGLISGKLIDLVVYTSFAIIEYHHGLSELFLLNISKFRYFIVITELLPIILVGFYLFLFRHNLGKQDRKIERIARRNTIIFSIFFFFTFLIIVIIQQSITFFSIIAGVMSLLSISFIIWMFITAYRGKILPEINSLIISIGYILALIFNVLLSILLNIMPQVIAYGEAIAITIMEGGSIISNILFLIGFKTKSHYKV